MREPWYDARRQAHEQLLRCGLALTVRGLLIVAVTQGLHILITVGAEMR